MLETRSEMDYFFLSLNVLLSEDVLAYGMEMLVMLEWDIEKDLKLRGTAEYLDIRQHTADII